MVVQQNTYPRFTHLEVFFHTKISSLPHILVFYHETMCMMNHLGCLPKDAVKFYTPVSGTYF